MTAVHWMNELHRRRRERLFALTLYIYIYHYTFRHSTLKKEHQSSFLSKLFLVGRYTIIFWIVVLICNFGSLKSVLINTWKKIKNITISLVYFDYKFSLLPTDFNVRSRILSCAHSFPFNFSVLHSYFLTKWHVSAKFAFKKKV